jgi:ferric-dicitrate binding protein FerR (iron transport regulator)
MDQNFHNNERIDDLIVNYLSHQLSANEREELHTWLSQSDENRRYFIEMQDLWNTLATQDKDAFNSEAAYRRFKARISFQYQSEGKKRHKHFPSPFYWAAAVIAAFIFGGLSFLVVNNEIIQHNTKQYAIYVPYGAKTRVVLPDNSVVWLNAGSTLRYGQNFGQKSRQVALVGEGYFEIAHNPAMPFTVNANQASVKVLGTKFDVKAYPEDKRLDVTLLRGSIQLTTIYQPNKILKLNPNQLAVIDKTHQNVTVEQVDACEAAAWTKGKIVFDEELFGQIVRRLERDYNVTIDVKDPRLNNLRFYGDFRNAQSIQEILNIMTSNNEFHYTMNENHISVYQ